MKISPRPLFVLHHDEQFIGLIARAAGHQYGLHSFRTWTELHAAISAAPPSLLVVVDPFSGVVEREIAPELRTLALDFPSTPLIAAFSIRQTDSEMLLRLAKYGVCSVINIGHDDTLPAVIQRLAGALGRPLKHLVTLALPTNLPGRAHAIIDAAAETVTFGGDARDLAGALDMSRRTLLRWVLASKLPAPRRLLAWMRILLAANLLDDRARGVADVARTCGYSSDSGLRRITTRFTGYSPTELRQRGAFARASKAFLEELALHRDDVARDRPTGAE